MSFFSGVTHYKNGVRIEAPSQPLFQHQPLDEFDFKPILNPPPEFYNLRPVRENPFTLSDDLLTAPSPEDTEPYLEQHIDVISAPYEDFTILPNSLVK